MLTTVVVVAGVAVACGNGGSGGSGASSTSSAAASDIASANDTAPVSLILADPTCAQVVEITDAAFPVMRGTEKIDNKIPASQWSAEQRTAELAAADAMKKMADQLVPLAKQTPHRVMRELYEQAIAYDRAFAARINDYTIDMNPLQLAGGYFLKAVGAACSSDMVTKNITGLASPAAAPLTPGEIPNPDNPAPIMPPTDAMCSDWLKTQDASNAGLDAWSSGWDITKSVSQWTDADKALVEGAKPYLQSDVEYVNGLLSDITSPALHDFLSFVALYEDVFIKKLDTYESTDSNLYATVTAIEAGISMSCQAKL